MSIDNFWFMSDMSDRAKIEIVLNSADYKNWVDFCYDLDKITSQAAPGNELIGTKLPGQTKNNMDKNNRLGGRCDETVCDYFYPVTNALIKSFYKPGFMTQIYDYEEDTTRRYLGQYIYDLTPETVQGVSTGGSKISNIKVYKLTDPELTIGSKMLIKIEAGDGRWTWYEISKLAKSAHKFLETKMKNGSYHYPVGPNGVEFPLGGFGGLTQALSYQLLMSGWVRPMWD